MSAAGKSPPTTFPSGSASPLEGGAPLSASRRAFQHPKPLLRPPGRRAAPSRDRRAEGLTTVPRNATHDSLAATLRLSSRFRRSRRPGTSNPQRFGSDLSVAASAPPRGPCLRNPTHSSGYWTPAYAGVTAEEVAIQSRLTPAEVANGSRLSGFACGRDDLREEETPSHPLCRHPGRAQAQSRGLLASRAVATALRLSPYLPAPPSPSSSRASEARPGTGEPRSYGEHCPKPAAYPPGRQSGAAASVSGARPEVGHDRSSDSHVVLLRSIEQRARRGPSGPRRQTVSPSL